MAAPIRKIMKVNFVQLFRVVRVKTNVNLIHTATAVPQKYENPTSPTQIPGSEYQMNQLQLENRTKFAVDKDSDFTWVDKIIPTYQIPPPPTEPMPSGWKPPTAKMGDYPYYIPRTSTHHLPVYLREKNNKLRKTTVVRHIDGDIWALEIALRNLLETKHQCQINTEVNEVSRVVKINGIYQEDVAQFLLDQGF